MAEWHGFAKLRMHSDSTLEHLEQLTKEFGFLMRKFQETSACHYKTYELPREVAARNRRLQADLSVGRAPGDNPASHTGNTDSSVSTSGLEVEVSVLASESSEALDDAATTAPTVLVRDGAINSMTRTAITDPTAFTPIASTNDIAIVNTSSAPEKRSVSRKERLLNLSTYKFHAMGDYIRTIRMFGGTDSFSTQLGELAHRLVKRLYGLTNKRNATKQIGNRVRRLERVQMAAQKAAMKTKTLSNDISNAQTSAAVNHDTRYHISRAKHAHLDVYSYVRKNVNDPAFKSFIPKLKDNILGRLLKRAFDGDTHDEYTEMDRNTVHIHGDRLYQAKTCRMNYTTYDIRRDGDTINPKTYPDIMVNSPETGPDAQPFWYGRVIGIFHALVSTSHSKADDNLPQHMDFLWVRWFGVEPGRYRHGFRYARLPKIGFIPSSDDYAFTFLDPAQVIRGVHLIPAFNEGRTTSLLPPVRSAGRVLIQDEEDDWVNFYVNIFLDRDMLMRHFGNGVGHLHCSKPEDCIEEEGAEGEEGRVEEEESESMVNEDGNEESDMESDSSLDSDDTGYGSF